MFLSMEGKTTKDWRCSVKSITERQRNLNRETPDILWRLRMHKHTALPLSFPLHALPISMGKKGTWSSTCLRQRSSLHLAIHYLSSVAAFSVVMSGCFFCGGVEGGVVSLKRICLFFFPISSSCSKSRGITQSFSSCPRDTVSVQKTHFRPSSRFHQPVLCHNHQFKKKKLKVKGHIS